MMKYRLPNVYNRRLLDPHVVIIGAGASIAACKFDKHGYQVPLLKNIHTVLGLTDKLKQFDFSIEEMQDFELLFSNIHEKPEYAELQKELKSTIFEYFSKLELPDTPTYYDYLILSLTSKDAIISFNWDPFLVQAFRRNFNVGNLPKLIFPHGNAAVSICCDCKIKEYGDIVYCSCGKEFSNIPLLFPVGKKNYRDKSIIQNEWNQAEWFLSRAAGITVYGYGAPNSDLEAILLLKKAYTESKMKLNAPFEIINLPSEEQEQKKKWAEFFSVRMILYSNSFEDSMLWRNPRVSLETLFDAILQQHPREQKGSFSKFENLTALQEFAKSISGFEMFI
jgi:hypothetical protein